MMIIRTFLISATALALSNGVRATSIQGKALKGDAIICKLEPVFDTRSHANAYTYFVPKGWTPSHDLSWGADPGAYHVTVSAATQDQQYEVTQLGNDTYQFHIIHGMNGGPPMVDNPPVHHATEYLRILLHKVLTAEGAAGVGVVDEVNAPLPPEKVPAWLKNAPVPPWETRVPANETGFLQVRFTLGGRSMTAMVGTTIKGFSSTSTLPGKNTVAGEGGFFEVGPTTFLIMPTDAPESKQREMKIIADSIRMTAQFRDYLRELTDRVIKIKMGAAAAAQRYADSTFHERSMAQFDQQMNTRDSYSHAFCNYVSDQQDYKDQSGHVVAAPASFKYAWSDGSGNYLLNDDASVDMRGLGSGNWKLMQRAGSGE